MNSYSMPEDAGPMDATITFTVDGVETLKLTQYGFIYNDHLIEDAGAARRIWLDVMKLMQDDLIHKVDKSRDTQIVIMREVLEAIANPAVHFTKVAQDLGDVPDAELISRLSNNAEWMRETAAKALARISLYHDRKPHDS